MVQSRADSLVFNPRRGVRSGGACDGAAQPLLPKVENGVAVPCSLMFKVNFKIKSGHELLPASGLTKQQSQIAFELKQKAVWGSEFAVGLRPRDVRAFRPQGRRQADSLVPESGAGRIACGAISVGAYLMAGSAVEADPWQGRRWLEMAATEWQRRGSNFAGAPLVGCAARRRFARAGTCLDGARRRGEPSRGHVLLSALLAAWPDPARRDRKRALKLLEQVGHLFEYDPTLFEIRAAAGQVGKFQGRAEVTGARIAMAKRLGWKTAALDSRLKLYQQEQAFSGALIEF